MPSLADTTLDKRERIVVARLVEALRAHFGERLAAVWLYGSRARGEYPGPDSDVDLLVILTTRGDADLDTALELGMKTADAEGLSPFDFSIQVYDLDWLAGRRAIDSFFIQEVDRDKVVLLERS